MPSPDWMLVLPTLAADVDDTTWFATVAATLLFALDWSLRLGTSARIVMRRLSVESALAWLVIVLLFPLVGAGIYWAFGELRIGRKRAERFLEVHRSFSDFAATVRRDAPTHQLDPRYAPFANQAEQVGGYPALPGNTLTLMPSTNAALDAIADDIRGAQHTVEMLYYIFLDGPRSQPVIDALLDAAQRGVRCRVLLDALGSRSFLKSEWGRKLDKSDVQLVAALPARWWRLLIQRVDLRNHRKLTMIDGRVAYTGSMNLVGARRLAAAEDVGPWIDATVKVTGPCVAPLYAMFVEDWEAETGEKSDDLEARTRDVLASSADNADGAWTQVVPTGPHVHGQSIRELVLTGIYAARETLTLTTPYFAPDDALLTALTSAASRGVAVTLILPERLDSQLAHHAGNAHVQQLLDAGVQVARFRGGVLHTKSMTIDGHATLLGTVNLDARSFYLNFELSLWVYDTAFTGDVRALQAEYLGRSILTDPQAWAHRPWRHQLLERTLRLTGPLL
ncbi:MAG: cardiolipin synthase [Planctomycetota bacterium]